MKNKILWLYLLIFLTVFGLSITFITLLITEFPEIPYLHKIIASSLVFLVVFLISLNLFSNYFLVKRRREDIKDSFDYYIETQIASSGAGAIIFNKKDEIIWASKFIDDRFAENIIGKQISMLSNRFKEELQNGKTDFRFEYGGFVFATSVNFQKRIIVFKDVTNEEKILKQYIAEKIVIGEIEIDNFQQMQISFSEEELFSCQNVVIKTLDQLSEKWNFIYRQYVNGKFVFFTDQQTLDAMVESDFKFVKAIRSKKVDNMRLSVSIGIGFGTGDKNELQELARYGLKQAHTRGGDQIAVVEFNKKPVYYGSQFELRQSSSLVKISKIANLFAERIMSKSIQNVIIYGHKLADLDAVGAALGIKSICESFLKDVAIGNITFDKTTETALKQDYSSKEISDLFVSSYKSLKLTSKNTMVIIVDTSDLSLIENNRAFFKVLDKNIFIFDHHRTTEQVQKVPPQNVYIDSNASSTSEIVVELLTFMKNRIELKKRVAQMLLNGIFLDTSIFTKSVSSRTYAAASFLEKHGANSAISSSIMKVSEEAMRSINLVLKDLQEIKPGYFLAAYDGVIPNDYISMAANEVLRTKGRKASFVIARTSADKKHYKMSARGVNTNVQKIAEQVGGGGHFSAAAALSKEPLSIFIDNLRQAIISERKGD